MATLSFSLVTYASGSARLGMAMLILFLAAGLILLIGTRYPAVERPDKR
jgi:MFS transporter, UMF1 family